MKGISLIILAIAILGGVIAFGGPVLADDFGVDIAANTAGMTQSQISQQGDIPTVLGYIVSIALSLVGVYFFIMILYAGIVWMTAMGSSEKVGKAKSKMISASIGLVIVLSAYTITRFVIDVFANDPSAYCATTKDGVAADETSANETCMGGKIVSECEYVFKEYGAKCTSISSCKGRIFGGLCPGGVNEKCCLPNDQVTRYLEAVTSGKAGTTNQGTAETAGPTYEASLCEKNGDFCASESSCEGLMNGQSMGQNGCQSGQVCCRNCLNSIGGNCVSDDTKCVPGGAWKNGYCFGAFAGQLCCTGKSLE